MNRVGMNIVIGTFWIIVAIWMFFNGGGTAEDQVSAAILVILGLMFYWAAYKTYITPSTRRKQNKSLVEKLTDPNYKNTVSKKKK